MDQMSRLHEGKARREARLGLHFIPGLSASSLATRGPVPRSQGLQAAWSSPQRHATRTSFEVLLCTPEPAFPS